MSAPSICASRDAFPSRMSVYSTLFSTVELHELERRYLRRRCARGAGARRDHGVEGQHGAAGEKPGAGAALLRPLTRTEPGASGLANSFQTVRIPAAPIYILYTIQCFLRDITNKRAFVTRPAHTAFDRYAGHTFHVFGTRHPRHSIFFSRSRLRGRGPEHAYPMSRCSRWCASGAGF